MLRTITGPIATAFYELVERLTKAEKQKHADQEKEKEKALPSSETTDALQQMKVEKAKKSAESSKQKAQATMQNKLKARRVLNRDKTMSK